MITYVKLKNYKSLVDFEVDLTDSKNNPKKMVIIYGENGAGKTHFISAFFTLSDILRTKSYKNKIDKFADEFMEKNSNNILTSGLFPLSSLMIFSSEEGFGIFSLSSIIPSICICKAIFPFFIVSSKVLPALTHPGKS